jgi:WW domain
MDSLHGEVESVSGLYHEQFTYQCPTRPIIMTTEKPRYIVQAFASRADDVCSGFVFNFSKSFQDEVCTTDDVLLIDVDVEGENLQSGLVLVSLTSHNNAQLTLDLGSMDDVDILYDQVQMRSSIVFLCPPEKLSLILSNIHYQNMNVGEDKVDVIVQYGGMCNNDRNHILLLNNNRSSDGDDSNDNNQDCHTSHLVIHVDVVENPQRQHKEFVFQSFPWIPLPFTMCMLLLLKLRGKSRELMIAAELGDDDDDDVNDYVDEDNSAPPVVRTDTDTTADETLSTTDNDDDAAVADWKQHVDDASGHFYYENLFTGQVTWDVPDGGGRLRILLDNGRVVVN